MSYGLVLADEKREAGSRPLLDLSVSTKELSFVG